MKKILALACFAIFICAGLTYADTYTVAVDTHTPTTVQGQADGSFPNIDGGAKIESISIANSAAVVQTITLYELSSSTTTAAAKATYVIESTGTLNIPFISAERIEDLGIIKSTTGSTVNVTVEYK